MQDLRRSAWPGGRRLEVSVRVCELPVGLGCDANLVSQPTVGVDAVGNGEHSLMGRQSASTIM